MLLLQSLHVHRNDAGTNFNERALRGSPVLSRQYTIELLDAAPL